jgi:azurin
MKVMKTFFALIALGLSGAFLHADQKITVSGNDLMQFDTKEFTVSAGENVELEFKNIGKMPKIAMGHNLVILNIRSQFHGFWSERCWAWEQVQPIHYRRRVRVMFLAATKLLGPERK